MWDANFANLNVCIRSIDRGALSEMSVLLDVISIAKNKNYLVLDPVSQEPSEYKPIHSLVAKKKVSSLSPEMAASKGAGSHVN